MKASITKTERVLLVAVSILLIYGFLSALIIPETERPSAGLGFLTVLIDVVMVIALVGLAIRRLKATEPSGAVGPLLVLPVIGILAGLGSLLIRFSGAPDHELPPRSTLSDRPDTLAERGDLQGFVARLENAGTDYKKAEAAVSATNWLIAGAEDRRTLPRTALQEFVARTAALVASIDKIIELLEEPNSDVLFARLVTLAGTQGEEAPSLDAKAGWHALRRAWAAQQRCWSIADGHWEEWRANSEPSADDPKPWQQEMAEWERESAAAGKEHKSLTASPDAPLIEAPLLVQGGGRLAAVVHDIRRQFGAARVIKEVTITREGVGLVVRDAENPAQLASAFRSYKSLAKEEDFDLKSRLLAGGEIREAELFGVDEVDWARAWAVTRAGLEKIPLPGGRVVDVTLVRRFHPLRENAPEWKVRVANGGLFDGEHGDAFFDARSGELTDLELPKSLMKPAAYLQPENTRALLATILEDFGPETRFIELSIEDERALLTATRPEHADDLRRYGYTATERAKLGKHDPIRIEDEKARDGIFTAAEVSGFVSQLDRLRERAFKRLEMKDGRVTRMAFWRQNMVHGTNNKLVLELRCNSPTTRDGTVIYEVSGKEFYVALP